MAGAPIRIGLIADIQYSDCEDGTNFDRTETRHYRNALSITRNAVQYWNDSAVELVIQLGDLIDGCNAPNNSATAFADVLQVLQQCTARRLDLIGNHELYNIRRADLPGSGLQVFGEEGRTYRSEMLGGPWEAIILDPFETSLIGVQEGDPGYAEAVATMSAFNPKALQGPGDWFAGLPLDFHRFVPYNGGCSAAQVAWLEERLAVAAAAGRKVLVFTHIPLYAPATEAKTCVWNCDEVLKVLQAFSQNVVAVFAGHDHNGGYAVDEAGVHHITMCSPMTAAVDSDCFALLECYPDGRARFTARGRACVESATSGQGRAYESLELVRGTTNVPQGPALAGFVSPPQGQGSAFAGVQPAGGRPGPNSADYGEPGYTSYAGVRPGPNSADYGEPGYTSYAGATAGGRPAGHRDVAALQAEQRGLQQLLEMGFEREACILCLEAAGGSIEDAAAMLSGG